MNFRFPPRIAAPFLAVLALGFILTACSSDIEKSPAFQKTTAKLKELEDSQKKTAQSVESQYMSVDVLTEDVKAIKAALKNQTPGGGVPKEMEDRLAKLEQQLAALQAQSGKREPAPAPAAAPAPGVSAPAPAKTAPAVAPAAPGAAKPATAVKPATGAKPAPAKAAATPKPRAEKRAKGAYYQVREGDTLESIAAARKVTAARIREANRLPAGKEVPPGQSIFIPAE